MQTRANVLALLAAALLSCTVKNDASIELYAICRPPDDAGVCATSGKCELLLAERPWVATRRGGNRILNSLDLFAQINNQLPANGDSAVGRLNTHDFVIEEFRLKFTSVPPLPLPEYSYKQAFIVPAGGTSTPLVTLVPEPIMQLIDDANFDPLFGGSLAPNARLDVEVRIAGHTRDGSAIVSEGTVIPVDVYDVDSIGTTEVTVPPANLDPVCAGTTEVVTASCPHAGQTATHKCEAP